MSRNKCFFFPGSKITFYVPYPFVTCLLTLPRKRFGARQDKLHSSVIVYSNRAICPSILNWQLITIFTSNPIIIIAKIHKVLLNISHIRCQIIIATANFSIKSASCKSLTNSMGETNSWPTNQEILCLL
jgi:hypothetical protein